VAFGLIAVWLGYKMMDDLSAAQSRLDAHSVEAAQ
jgi:hypothetical protein